MAPVPIWARDVSAEHNDLRSLDFVINRLFMNHFKTIGIELTPLKFVKITSILICPLQLKSEERHFWRVSMHLAICSIVKIWLSFAFYYLCLPFCGELRFSLFYVCRMLYTQFVTPRSLRLIFPSYCRLKTTAGKQ